MDGAQGGGPEQLGEVARDDEQREPERQAPAFIRAMAPSLRLPAGTPARDSVPAISSRAAVINAAFAGIAPASKAALTPTSTT